MKTCFYRCIKCIKTAPGSGFATAVMALTAAVLCMNATTWEGVSSAVANGNLPGNYSVATNSFPRNSVVDITNLENGKMVRVCVVSSLDTTGLLAMLSRDAAEYIGLRGNATCRIRMTQPPDDIAFSNFKLGPIYPQADVTDASTPPEGDENIDLSTEPRISFAETPEQATVLTETSPAAPAADEAGTVGEEAASAVTETEGTEAVATAAVSTDTNAADTITPVAQEAVVITDANGINEENAADTTESAGTIAAADRAGTEAADTAGTEMAAVTKPADSRRPSIKYTFIPADEKIPKAANQVTLAPEDFVSPIDSVHSGSKPNAAESVSAAENVPVSENIPMLENIPVAESVSAAGNVPVSENIPALENIPVVKSVSSTENAPAPSVSPFGTVQLIDRLEQDMWYVQVAAYTRSDHVEDEISRIGRAYPLAVQNVGNDINPVFRILLGPLNQGECGAMLQRFKSIGYKDAFVWHN